MSDQTDGSSLLTGLESQTIFSPTAAGRRSASHETRIVLIVSDSRLLREALQRDLTRLDAGFDRVEAASREDAIDSVRRLDPDTVVLDCSSGTMATVPAMLRAISLRVRIIVLTATGTDAEFVQWAETGVHGYVDQDSSAADLVTVIQQAARGEVVCSSRLAGLLVGRVAMLSAERNKGRDVNSLTPRENQILHLIADGLSNKGIARRLDITEATAKNHVHRILDKLGLSSRGQAAAHCRRQRL